MIIVKRYTASWCQPCKMVAPIMEELKNEYVSKGVNFITLDVDENNEQANQDGVRSVPTVLIIKNGSEVHRIIGAQSKTNYQTALNSVL
jgi:thioredoxin 1